MLAQFLSTDAEIPNMDCNRASISAPPRASLSVLSSVASSSLLPPGKVDIISSRGSEVSVPLLVRDG